MKLYRVDEPRLESVSRFAGSHDGARRLARSIATPSLNLGKPPKPGVTPVDDDGQFFANGRYCELYRVEMPGRPSAELCANIANGCGELTLLFHVTPELWIWSNSRATWSRKRMIKFHKPGDFQP